LRRVLPASSKKPSRSVGTKDYQTPDGIRVAPALALLRTLI
jgi:hypothetical protein